MSPNCKWMIASQNKSQPNMRAKIPQLIIGATDYNMRVFYMHVLPLATGNNRIETNKPELCNTKKIDYRQNNPTGEIGSHPIPNRNCK